MSSSGKPRKTKSKSALAKLVRDEELLDSFERNPNQRCSVIVQAKLPKRQFSLGGNSRRLVRDKVPASSNQDRKTILEQLANQLIEIVGEENTNLLASAGSIVVTGTPKQFEEISKIENVEAIWKNRDLTTRGSGPKN